VSVAAILEVEEEVIVAGAEGDEAAEGTKIAAKAVDIPNRHKIDLTPVMDHHSKAPLFIHHSTLKEQASHSLPLSLQAQTTSTSHNKTSTTRCNHPCGLSSLNSRSSSHIKDSQACRMGGPICHNLLPYPLVRSSTLRSLPVVNRLHRRINGISSKRSRVGEVVVAHLE
jgi:hypothetical protein